MKACRPHATVSTRHVRAALQFGLGTVKSDQKGLQKCSLLAHVIGPRARDHDIYPHVSYHEGNMRDRIYIHQNVNL